VIKRNVIGEQTVEKSRRIENRLISERNKSKNAKNRRRDTETVE